MNRFSLSRTFFHHKKFILILSYLTVFLNSSAFLAHASLEKEGKEPSFALSKEERVEFTRFCIEKFLTLDKKTVQSASVSVVWKFLSFYEEYSKKEIEGQKLNAPDLYNNYTKFLSLVTFLSDNLTTPLSDACTSCHIGISFQKNDWEKKYGEALKTHLEKPLRILSKINQSVFRDFEKLGCISAEQKIGAIRSESLAEGAWFSELGFYKDEKENLLFLLPKERCENKIFTVSYDHGLRSLEGLGTNFFVIDNGEPVHHPGFVVEKNELGLEVVGYYGHTGDRPFQPYRVYNFLPAGSSKYTSMLKAIDRESEISFIYLPTNEREYNDFRHAMLEEIKELVQDLFQTKRLALEKEKIALLLEAFSSDKPNEEPAHLPLAAPSLKEREEEKDSGITAFTLAGSSSNETSDEEIRDAYLREVAEQQEAIRKLVASGEIYEETKPKSNPIKAKKEKKLSKKEAKRAKKAPNDERVSAPSTSTAPSLPQNKGAVKFRTLAKLIKGMAKDMKSDDLHFVVKGSHMTLHASGKKSMTLVQLHGKKKSGIPTFRAEETIKRFMDFFMSGSKK